MPVKLIAHCLIQKDGKFLLIKRSPIKRGNPNVFPNYWDIPGGGVEESELARQAVLRECLEESNQLVELLGIIHEDSQFDHEKQTVYTRLVYSGVLREERPLILDPEEHSDYRWISSLDEMDGQLIVPYLRNLIKGKTSKKQLPW